MRLIQLVPQLPPAISGVGDYAFLLSKELARLGIENVFVVPDRRDSSAALAECRRAVPNVMPSQPQAASLVQVLDAWRPDAVLVHFSGYGFSPRGCPSWLIEGLHRWHGRRHSSKLVVMFHELAASSRVPWRSSFWLAPLQRRLAQALARMADVCVTNCGCHSSTLQRWRPPDADNVLVWPVPSNVGEPADLRPFSERDSVAVVFGQNRRRREVYHHMPAFMPFLQWAGVRGLDDIGPPLESDLYEGLPLPLRVHGIAGAAQVSALLSRAKFGLLHLPAHLLGKSGCFAAFAAHGVVCLLSGKGTSPSDEAGDGKHFIGVPLSSSESIGERNCTSIAENVFSWYAGHRVPALAGQFTRVLF